MAGTARLRVEGTAITLKLYGPMVASGAAYGLNCGTAWQNPRERFFHCSELRSDASDWANPDNWQADILWTFGGSSGWDLGGNALELKLTSNCVEAKLTTPTKRNAEPFVQYELDIHGTF